MASNYYTEAGGRMGDAYSDTAKVSREEQNRDVYLRLLAMYLANNVEEEPPAELLAAARESGLFENNLFKTAEEQAGSTIRQLRNDDPVQWTKLLDSIEGSEYYATLKDLSPFKGRMLIQVLFGNGFVRISTKELERFIGQQLEDRQMPREFGREYAVTILEEAIKGYTSVMKIK